jgi:hypothetical protein
MERFISRLQYGMFFAAALWAVGAGLWLALRPYTIEVTTASTGGAAAGETFYRQVSFYEVQGAWGLFVLVVFALLYTSGFFFFRSGRRWLAVLGTTLALALTVLAGFSIGPAYLPGAVAAMIAVALILFTAIMPPRSAGLS